MSRKGEAIEFVGALALLVALAGYALQVILLKRTKFWPEIWDQRVEQQATMGAPSIPRFFGVGGKSLHSSSQQPLTPLTGAKRC